MALKFAQGFETVRDDSDLRSQGWSFSPAANGIKKVASVPSVSGAPGWSLRQIGAYQSMAFAANTAWGTANDGTFGYLPTGFTVNQAWQAGGVTVGFGAAFNSGVSASFGSGAFYNPSAICFDGALYWAFRAIGTAYTLCTSPNLVTWTATSSQPFTGSASSTVTYAGGGVIVAANSTSTIANMPVWISTNNGSTWTSVNTFTTTNAYSVYATAVATGTASAPHVVSALGRSSSGTASLSVGNLTTGSLTSVFNATGNYLEALNLMRPYSNNGLIIVASPDSGGQPTGFQAAIYSASIGNANIATAAAWTKAIISMGRDVYITGIEYHPTSNLWVVSSSDGSTTPGAVAGGIWTFPNTGAAGTAVAPSGTVTMTHRYQTIGMSAVFKPAGSSTLVAVGQQGHIITSTDGGITWVESSPKIIQSGTSGTDWASCFYDGSRYVLTTDATSGIVATTTDGLINYQAQYIQEAAEVAWTVGSNSTGTGLLSVSAPPNATTGQFTWNGNNGSNAVLQVGSPSGGNRTIALWNSNPNTQFFSTVLSNSVPYHYYEMRYTAIAGSTNAFLVSLFIDGTLIGTSTSQLMATATDTTTSMVLGFQRNGCWTAYDDIRITLDNGQGISGAIGPINIMARRPTADVQAQWTRSGTAASNALSVNQPAISSWSSNFVTSANAGDKDIYSSTDTVPAGYTVKAVTVEGYFSRASTSGSTVSVGVVSGSSELDSGSNAISATTPTFVNVIAETDPNGNVAWTNASVNASRMAINHIS